MATHVGVSEVELNGQTAIEFVNSKHCGAVSLFLGVTRDEGGAVVALEFEAHVPLLVAQLEQIVTTARMTFPELANVYIVHRLGTVPVGQTNIVVAASSPHRSCAMQAVESLMQNIKAQLPIWKKELFRDKSFVWKHNTENKWA